MPSVAAPRLRDAVVGKHPRRALLVGLDDGHAGLVRLWLAEAGWDVCEGDAMQARCDLIVLQTRHPRRHGSQETMNVELTGRRAPVLLISPSVLAGTPPIGALAGELGVAAVLSVPLERIGFVALCERLVEGSTRGEGQP